MAGFNNINQVTNTGADFSSPTYTGMVTISEGMTWGVKDIEAATYDLLSTDHILSAVYTATGAITSLTLPTAQCTRGREVIVKDSGGNAGTNNITIDTEGSEKIDGADTYVINNDYDSITLFSDGSNWFVI